MGAVCITPFVSHSTCALIGLSAPASARAVTMMFSFSVSSPSCRATTACSPLRRARPVAADATPCSSATIEQSPAGTASKRNSPASFETATRGSRAGHVSVTLTPGTANGCRSVPGTDTAPATAPVGGCAMAGAALKTIAANTTLLNRRCIRPMVKLSSIRTLAGSLEREIHFHPPPWLIRNGDRHFCERAFHAVRHREASPLSVIRARDEEVGRHRASERHVPDPQVCHWTRVRSPQLVQPAVVDVCNDAVGAVHHVRERREESRTRAGRQRNDARLSCRAFALRQIEDGAELMQRVIARCANRHDGRSRLGAVDGPSNDLERVLAGRLLPQAGFGLFD